MFALLIHMYNHESWEKIFRQRLIEIRDLSPTILINLCITHPGNSELISSIRKDFPDACIITTPNKGRDIGGKLALVDFFIKIGSAAEYIVFLHDKESHHFAGESWREKLLEIIKPEKIEAILNYYRDDPKTGVIGASKFIIRHEYNKKANEFKTTNNKKIKELISTLNLKLSDPQFVAGTMFWVRSSIIKRFFTTHSALGCREMLEEGNFSDQYQGTYTHSWERIFCFLANDQGYTIKGI